MEKMKGRESGKQKKCNILSFNNYIEKQESHPPLFLSFKSSVKLYSSYQATKSADPGTLADY